MTPRQYSIMSGNLMLYGADCTIDILHNYETGNIKGFGVIMTEDSILNEGEIQAYGGNLNIITDGFLTNIDTLSNLSRSLTRLTAIIP